MTHSLFLQTGPGEGLANFVTVLWPVLLPAVLGLAGIYLLLPRARRFPPLYGAALGGAALVLAGIFLVRASAALPETILFYAFAAVAVVGGVLLVTHHNPVYAALAFALVVLSTCGLFLLLAAPFLMAATVIIYAGAIIVTFLFVIMLAQQAGLSGADLRSREPFLATLAGFVLLAALLCVLRRTYDTSALDPYLARAEQLAGATSGAEVRQAIGEDPLEFFQQFRAAAERDPLHPDAPPPEPVPGAENELVRAIDATQEAATTRPLNPKALRRAVDRIYSAAYLRGSIRPPLGLPLSPFSGAVANSPPPPLDDAHRPVERLPAENVASLGRSLFTDYLLAVELAGTLLLVATIGAIAIAGRRAEGLR
jgi:NADH:ubiquinone oxidoreductase subunit 6 (subunit J)